MDNQFLFMSKQKGISRKPIIDTYKIFFPNYHGRLQTHPLRVRWGKSFVVLPVFYVCNVRIIYNFVLYGITYIRIIQGFLKH